MKQGGRISSTTCQAAVVIALVLLVMTSTNAAEPQTLLTKDIELGQAENKIQIDGGQLSVQFRDNSQSPPVLSGISSLVNVKNVPGYNAFGAHVGLNFEHIISGHYNEHNKFTPRHGTYTLHRLADKKSVMLVRRKEDSPWNVESTFQYRVQSPHYIDFDFRCIPHDASLFGDRGYGIFFFAHYMNDVAEIPFHFLGIDQPGGKEKWISANAPPGHADWNKGGTYLHADGNHLKYDDAMKFRLNNWSYDYPRFTKPFYYGHSKNGMVFILMLDRTVSATDQVRFSLFKFMAPELPKDKPKHPARDFQYVINNVEAGKEYGFRGRLVWKKFISRDDCLKEYEAWKSGLASAEGPVSKQQPARQSEALKTSGKGHNTVQHFKTADGVEFGVWPKLADKPAPTLFVLGSTIDETLGNPYFRQCGNQLAEKGYQCVSIDLPCHGSQQSDGIRAGLVGWADRVEKNWPLVEEANKRLSSVLSHLIDSGKADARRIAVCGTSRGGYLALHFANSDARVDCVAAFAPVTDLAELREFTSIKELPAVKSWAIHNHAQRLSAIPVWLVIGDQDQRVSTEKTIQLARQLTAAAVKNKQPSSVDLHVMAEPRGHTTPDGSVQLAADWIDGQLKPNP